MINLEQLLLEENKLQDIFEQLHVSPDSAYKKCEEWWDLTKDQYSLFEVYKIYKDEITRKQIRKALIF